MLQICRLLTLAFFNVTVIAILGSGLGFAAIRTVTNTNDSGTGSLRDAIAIAATGDTVNFKLSTYPATITLSSGLSIITSLTINGPGSSNLAISGGGNGVRLLIIGNGISVGIFGVAIENGGDVFSIGGGGIYSEGTLTLSNSAVSHNECVRGGGIYNSGGTLTLINSTVSDNVGDFGSGIVNSGGTLTITNTTISGNTGIGGAIYNGGTLTMTASIVSGNGGNFEATSGGGITNAGTLMMIKSTVSGNSAGIGGGITNSGTLTMINSNVSGNNSRGSGGGIYNSAGALTLINTSVAGNNIGMAYTSTSPGGGIFNSGGAVTLTNSTISGNEAHEGGGIGNGGTVTLTNSTVSGNLVASVHPGGGISNTGTLNLKNTILANNNNLFGTGGNCAVPGFPSSYGHNLSDDNTCSDFFNPAIGDLNNTPAGLDSSGLQNNGGPTQTIALLPTSPAVNAVPTSYCTAIDGVTSIGTDQRGLPRPQGSACDIGAYEYLAITGPAPTSNTTCNGAYNGTFNGNIKVSAGQNCIFFGGVVTGNVQQGGGSLVFFQSQVDGNVQIDGSGTFVIGPSSTIGGNLQIQNLFSSGVGENQVCSTTVKGNLQVQNNGAPVMIGALLPNPCAGNIVGGNLQIQTNFGATTAVGNAVGGNLQDQNNGASTQVFNNTVSGNLQCQNNSSISGGGNSAGGQKQGQCAGF